MKRPEVVAAAETGSMPDAGFAKSHPLLSEYLVTDRYEDGAAREKSSVSISVQDGAVLAVLNDRDVGRGLYVVGGTLAEALRSLEKHLGQTTVPWRVWKGFKRGKKSP